MSCSSYGPGVTGPCNVLFSKPASPPVSEPPPPADSSEGGGSGSASISTETVDTYQSYLLSSLGASSGRIAGNGSAARIAFYTDFLLDRGEFAPRR
jgi:hypothetical protein